MAPFGWHSGEAHVRKLTAVLAAAVAAMAAGGLLAPAQAADDYSDPDYLAYDLDNMARTTERQGYHFTSPEYGEAFRETAFDTWLQGVSRQFRDADEARVYAGVGQILPGGSVGDPEAHRDGPRLEVEFLNREGTKLVGNVWPCRTFLAGTSGPCPGVVITTGSIQVTQHMYGWLARHLQANGYTVFTFDVRGQGESETTNQSNPFASNPQDGANFQNGTVDALNFLLSDANPARGSVDGDHLALIGHSLGASAVSVVQECTSTPAAGAPVPADTPPGACQGRRYPIRAIVAYDSLSATGAIDPQVPAFEHRADGYFINAAATPAAPAADDRTKATSAYGQWTGKGLDACTVTGRGFTHAEWSEIPYIVSATRYGVPQAKYYTRAWLDRFVHPSAAVNEAGQAALTSGPTPAELAGAHLDHRATLFSGKYLSACDVSAVGAEPAFVEDNLRTYGGAADVGDWAGINAEREYGTPQRGLLHDPPEVP